MAPERESASVLLFVSLLAGRASLLDAARDRLAAGYGAPRLTAGDWGFDETGYYEAEFGTDLRRRMIAFETLIRPDDLADIKRATNRMEQALGETQDPCRRRVNVDPGVLTEFNVVLATMKPYGHRVCLDGGVYAEASLRFAHGAYVPMEWTYRSYRRPEVLAFFQDARKAYLELRGRDLPVRPGS